MIWNDDAIIAELRLMKLELWQSRQRGQRIEVLLMTIKAEVQALLDAAKDQGDAITAATSEITQLESHITDLDAKLAAVPAGEPVDAENLAAIVAVTGTIRQSIENIKTAMPQPIAPEVVTAVEQAAPDQPQP